MERLTLAIGVSVFLSACLGDIEVPPDPPTVNTVESPTAVPVQMIGGQKDKGTSVIIDDEVVVEPDEETSWSATVNLSIGENVFVLKSRRASGLESRDTTTVTIVFEPPCPQAPTIDTFDPATNVQALTFTGSRPPGTALVLDGMEIIPLGDEQAWMHTVVLPDADGPHVLRFTARDAKDRDSDPAEAFVVLDRRPPQIIARYPPPGGLDIATNALPSVTFDGALQFAGGDPPPEAITVLSGGTPVPGILAFSVNANMIEWFPMTGALDPNAGYTVTIDPSLIQDTAGNFGNPSAPFGWTWTFTSTAGPDMTPPPAPTLEPVPATTTSTSVRLRGTKGPLTSVVLNGRKVVGVTPDTTWSFDLPLPVGSSSISISARAVTDIDTPLPGSSTIERTRNKPEPPTVDADVPMSVIEPLVSLSGTRPADTSILLNDLPVVCRAPETNWAYAASLAPGVNDLRLQTQDAEGNVSDPLIYSVAYEQAYDGPVPGDFQLQISFELRDLSQISGIREEFVTGANNFGVEVWVEGPIDLDETCIIENGVRQNIKYVATIEHYIGTKAQHKVPFVDEDYRGTDYLASLITGGAFMFHGLNPASTRRDANGRELDGLLAGITEDELRSNIDCFGSPIVDACTKPTVNSGRYESLAWTPRARNGDGLLEQGDYLLWIMINLDRDGSWLSANDFETCWGDPAFDEVGMHRVVTRIALGSEPYELEIPQSEEHFGPDREGADDLHFISRDGIRITWGPGN